MDTDTLVSEIRTRFNHHENKLYLQEKYINQLIYADQGGIWKITPALLAFLRSAGEYEFIADENFKPCRVHVPTLLEHLSSRYNEIMQAWYTEFQETSRLR